MLQLPKKRYKISSYVLVGHGHTILPQHIRHARLYAESEGSSLFSLEQSKVIPNMYDNLAQLNSQGLKNVRTVPLMFVAGEKCKKRHRERLERKNSKRQAKPSTLKMQDCWCRGHNVAIQ
jgi:cobalamin biosynthesis Co2+ chelatase CbiK